MLTPNQIEQLLAPLDPNRVQRDDKGMSHLAAWDVRRWLIRIFGPDGWSNETISLEQVYEVETKTKAGRPAWNVCYRAQVRLSLRGTQGESLTSFEDGAVGESTLPSRGDCHDMAMKTALSQALKRCAMNLGDQFGLSLYNNGSHKAVVGRTLAYDIESFPVDEAVKGDTEVAQVVEDVPEVPAGEPSIFENLLLELKGAASDHDLAKVSNAVAANAKKLSKQQIAALQLAWKDRKTRLKVNMINAEIEKVETQEDYDKVLKLIEEVRFDPDTASELVERMDKVIQAKIDQE